MKEVEVVSLRRRKEDEIVELVVFLEVAEVDCVVDVDWVEVEIQVEVVEIVARQVVAASDSLSLKRPFGSRQTEVSEVGFVRVANGSKIVDGYS